MPPGIHVFIFIKNKNLFLVKEINPIIWINWNPINRNFC